jgi:hypothetical protein
LKRGIACLLLLLSSLCLLTGCTALLNREYLSVEPHEPFSDSDSDSSALRVESYQGLVNAVLHLVSQGETHGVIGLYNYTRDVESDLTAACLEIAKEDPLGAYAVDYIKHDFVRIVSYYEANVYITYRRTPEQIKNIVSVTGSSAIKGELRDTLAAFAPEAVLQVSYLAEDEDYILQLIQQAYYDTPQAALGMPQVQITLYPDSGYRRIVEIQLTYPDSLEQLRARRDAALSAAQTLQAKLQALPADQVPFELLQLLQQEVSPGDGSTAYHALVEGQADSQGMALACQLLCQSMQLEGTVVRGELEGNTHFWNIVYTQEGYRHLDASQPGGALLTDQAWEAAGYTWDREEYSPCLAPTESLGDENLGNNS